MNDFDRIFDPQYTATELFTNRVDEHTAFTTALQHHVNRVLDGSATLGVTARRNVMTFYGVGGIGKTELARRLESWCVGGSADPAGWSEVPRLGRPLSTVRTDFHGSRTVNPADIVLRLRAAAAGRRRRFPAFDLGLAAWWSLARPGMPLPDLSAGGFDVREQITDTLNDILSDVGAGFGLAPLTARTGIRIVEAVRENRLRSRTVRECTPLLHVLNQAQQDPSEYVAATLAGLLSWDIENLSPSQRPVTVAFADAAEYIQGEDRTQERLFNRIVHLTPGTLWVVTSRNRLDWDAPHLQQILPASGPHVWPGLRLGAEHDPRQHLVGNLSDADVEQYLRAASGVAGTPELPEGVINNIRAGSHGLPLYLSLSISVARSLRGNTMDESSFGGPLPELATRVFANLPRDERDLARAASLLPRFDEELIARASGETVGDAHRLCQRTLVTRDDHPLFPYRLHDAVRSAIAHEPISNPGAWAPGDRREMAAKLLTALRDRSDALLGNSERRLDVLEMAASLCAGQDMAAHWLADALSDIPGFAKTAERLPNPGSATWVGQLSGIYEAWRRGRGRRDRISYLEDFLAQPLLPDIRRRASLRLAYVYRDGDFDDALRVLRELLAADPDSELVRYQVARTLHTMGEYEELERHLDRYPLRDSTTSQRIRSDLAFDRGFLDEAILGPTVRAGILRAQGKHRVALENESSALWRRTLHDRSTPQECEAVLADADRFGEVLSMRTALAAKVICLRRERAAARVVIDEAQSLIDAKGQRAGWREWVSRGVLALYQEEPDAVEELHEAWLAASRRWSPNYQLLDRVFVFAGYPARCESRRVSLSEAPAVIDERWRSIIEKLVCP
ncbi:tetratricopeptide repeat protein [Actinacidiphila glaucinigra]|uniref:tetratricopeptide repeat protein n=1 Tax=Actinacidiphila glaucinigra TaxID=235986 RepID=UPI0033E65C34